MQHSACAPAHHRLHSLRRSVPQGAWCRSFAEPQRINANRQHDGSPCYQYRTPAAAKASPTVCRPSTARGHTCQVASYTQAWRHGSQSLRVLPAAATVLTKGCRMAVKAVTAGGITSSCGDEVRDEAAAAAAAAPPLFGAGTKGRVVVVGAGLAGVLAASLFAKKGYQVAVFEKRDLTATTRTGRTFPVTLSFRARDAAVAAGLDHGIITNNPISGGMVGIGQKLIPTPDHIISYAVDRITIGQQLVAAAQQRYPKEISFHFGYEVSGLDLAGRTLKVTPSVEGVEGLGVDEVAYDLLVAADGSYSRVRELCEQQDPDLQVSIPASSPTVYCTIHGLPTLPDLPWIVDQDKAALIGKTYLRVAVPHGWIRPWLNFWDTCDGSFTAMACIPTHMPTTTWVAELVRDKTHPNATQVEQLKEALSDALALLPQEWQQNVVQQLPNMKFSSSGRILWCSKLTCDRVVLLGDAGHAVSGALGQGANMAMEDVTVLRQVLDGMDSRNGTLDAALAEYSRQRIPDVHSMQMIDLLHRKFLQHPVKPEGTLTLRVLRAWQLFAYTVSWHLGAKLTSIWPRQKLFMPIYMLLAERVPFGQLWVRLQVQVAALLSVVVAVGSWLAVAAGRWGLTAAGLA